MKILYIVNTADSQSIPLELALRIRERHPNLTIASYYSISHFPADHERDSVIALGASHPFDVCAIKKLFFLIRDLKPNIIHTHHSVSSVLTTLISQFIHRDAILVKTEHNDHRHIAKHHLVANLLTFPVQSMIVCNSDTTLKSFKWWERLIAGDRVMRIYNGVDISRIVSIIHVCAEGERSEANDSFVLGHVGRLTAQKNQARLIKAFAAAKAVAPIDLKLEIVGDGPLREMLLELTVELGVGDAVTFLGGIGRNEVYQRFAGWNGFIMPSIYEGFCNALMEAIAGGLPIAVADLDTLREVAGATGIYFNPLDCNEIKNAILGLTEFTEGNPDWAHRYSMPKACLRHIDLYSELLASEPN